MKINVRWSDIRNGRSARTTECMVALALKRELGTDYASVGYEGGSVSADGKLLALYLPLAVRSKIGGLKGSVQHWPAVYPPGSEIPTFFVAVD